MKKIDMKTVLALFVTAFMLTACGKKDSGNAASALDTLKNETKNSNSAQQLKNSVATPDKLPQADTSTPDDKYVEVNSGSQLAYVYYAVSGMPIDYDKVASVVSRDYRSTSDEFKKQDLLNALKPKIDQQVSFFKQNRYIKVPNISMSLSHYDMSKKAFPLSGVPEGSSTIYFFDSSNYQIGVTNGSKFAMFPVSNEDDAKKIEEMVSHYQSNIKGTLYLFAQDTDLNGIVKFQLVKIKLERQNGEPLGEIKLQ